MTPWNQIAGDLASTIIKFRAPIREVMGVVVAKARLGRRRRLELRRLDPAPACFSRGPRDLRQQYSFWQTRSAVKRVSGFARLAGSDSAKCLAGCHRRRLPADAALRFVLCLLRHSGTRCTNLRGLHALLDAARPGAGAPADDHLGVVLLAICRRSCLYSSRDTDHGCRQCPEARIDGARSLDPDARHPDRGHRRYALAHGLLGLFLGPVVLSVIL